MSTLPLKYVAWHLARNLDCVSKCHHDGWTTAAKAVTRIQARHWLYLRMVHFGKLSVQARIRWECMPMTVPRLRQRTRTMTTSFGYPASLFSAIHGMQNHFRGDCYRAETIALRTSTLISECFERIISNSSNNLGHRKLTLPKEYLKAGMIEKQF